MSELQKHPYKQILEDIAELKKATKIEELEINLENSWEKYNDCQIFKQGNRVFVSLCVRSGKDVKIFTFPEDWRPKNHMFFPCRGKCRK